MPTQLIPLAELFTGGLNRAVSNSELQPNASPETRDARLIDRMPGRLGGRLGRTKALVGTYSFLGLGLLVSPFGRFRITADTNGDWTAAAVAWAGVTPTTPSSPSLTGMSATERVRFLQYKNRTYAFNGRNRPRCFDGKRWTNMGILSGIDLPQFTPSITIAGGTVANVITASANGTKATLTTDAAHGFIVGQSVTVFINDTAFNGSFIITDVTSTTFRYALAATIASETVFGTATAPASGGVTVVSSARATNIITITTSGNHNFATGQLVTFSAPKFFDGVTTGPITVTGATTFTFDGTASTPVTSGIDYATYTYSSDQAPTVTPATGGAASGITGQYYYFVVPACSTKLDVNGRMIEGIPSAISAVANPVDQSVTIGNIPATHTDITLGGAGVDRWNIYRTTDGGFDSTVSVVDQDFYYLGYVPLGTTTYTDTTDDSTGWYISGTNFNRMRFNQNIPPTTKFAAIYGDRIFAAGFDPISTGTVTAVGTALTFSGVSLPDGVKGCWIDFANDNRQYTIKKRDSTTTATLSDSVAGTAHAVTGVAVTDVITDTAHGYSNGQAVYFTVINGGSGLVINTVYFVRDVTTDTYKLAATSGGSAINFSTDITSGSTVVSTIAASTYTIYRPAWELYFSEFINPEAWGDDGEGKRNKVEVPGHQAITGLCGFSDHLLVFTATEIYVVTGRGPNRTDVRMLPEPFFSGLGALSCDAVVRVDNECHFLSKHGPAMISAGGPELHGIALNTDWLDPLTAAETKLACVGTDGQDVYWSVPSGVGQTLNSKSFRYARDTKSWWEEVGMCPTRFVRQDGTDGLLDVLYYLQGTDVIQPAYGTTDLVSALSGSVGAPYTYTAFQITSNVVTLSGADPHNLAIGDTVTVAHDDPAFAYLNGTYTVLGVPTSVSFTFALVHADASDPTGGTATPVTLASTTTLKVIGTPFPTSSGGLVETIVRFYDSAGASVAQRRVVSNTSNSLTWSTTSTLPYAGSLVLLVGYTFEIGNIAWDWQTRQLQVPGRRTEVQEVHVDFDTKLGNAITIIKTDIVDGVQSTSEHRVTEGQKATKWATNRSNRSYAARIASRTAGVVSSVTAEAIVESADK